MFKTFGNTVKIKSSPETEKSDTAEKIGEIYGETTPSVTGVDVIGNLKRDYAVNVYFKDTKTSLWFDEDLLEVINSGEDSIMTLGDKSFIKTKSGDWIPHKTNRSVSTKKWWQFWRE
jgi:hypothetical protein